MNRNDLEAAPESRDTNARADDAGASPRSSEGEVRRPDDGEGGPKPADADAPAPHVETSADRSHAIGQASEHTAPRVHQQVTGSGRPAEALPAHDPGSVSNPSSNNPGFRRAHLNTLVETAGSKVEALRGSSMAPDTRRDVSEPRAETGPLARGWDIGDLGLEGVSLMDGESIEFALNVTEEARGGSRANHNVVVLTNKRVLQLKADTRRRAAVFVSLDDIHAVEITTEQRGLSGFIWGGLALFVALMLWLTWDHPVGSVAGALAVALMGVYLIVDQLVSPSRYLATFKIGTSQIECGLSLDTPSEEIHGFVRRLFELRGEER